jgi:hypothetical protein
MAFQEKVLSLGTVDTLLFECPATLAGSAHGIVFSNITNGDKTIAVKLYTKATGLTTVVAQDRVVKANTEFAWPKPINLASGDQIIASASTLSSVAALVSIYLAASVPAAAGFTLRGEHSTIATYDPNEVVTLAGSSYVALFRNVNSPPPSANWMVSASKGDKGDPGLNVAAFEEGAPIATAMASLNFVGGGVAATANGSAVTVTVPLVSRATLGVDQLDNTADAAKPVSAATATALSYCLRVDTAAQGLTAPQQANAKTNLGLGNLDNTSDLAKPVSTAQQAALDAKASLVYVAAAVAQGKADIVASSPAALDTLNELAAALGNDANFAATTAAAMGNRLRVDTAAQGLTAPQQANAKTNLGLGNLDNTSDLNKPVSTATLSALNTKPSKTVVVDKLTGAAATTQTFDCSVPSVQRLQIGGALTIALANWPAGTMGELWIKLVNGAAFVVTWPTINWVKSDGSNTTSFASNGVMLQAAGTDWVCLWSTDAGATIYGKVMR